MLSRIQSKIMSASVPRHLRKPGDEGYRTPTIEDPEHPAHHGADRSAFASALCNRLEHDPMHVHSDLGCHGHHFGHNPHYCHSKDHSDVLKEWDPPEKLSFKQRVKHVTWAYFTITMATGGIANVISVGMAITTFALTSTNVGQYLFGSTAWQPLVSSSSC